MDREISCLRLVNETACRLSVRTRRARVFIPPLSALAVDAEQLDRGAFAAVEAQGVLTIQDPPQERLPSVVVRRLRLRRAQSALWRVGGRLREWIYLAIVLAIVFGVPGLILFFGSDVYGLAKLAADEKQSADQYAATVALIGVGMQELCIVGASALPILLYFVFDREKLKTLREKFVRHVFRLDSSVETTRDLDAKYGSLLGETYGHESDERFLRERDRRSCSRRR